MLDTAGKYFRQWLMFPLFVGGCLFFQPVNSFAQSVTLNVLTVNGTDEVKDKDISLPLPAELTQEDILDTDSLQLDYDPAVGAYVVKGKVTLNPKESRTFKIRVNDVWQIKKEDVDAIRSEMDASIKRLENTEFHDNALKRKEQLEKRLNQIVLEQEKYADNVDKRVDAFRSYADDFAKIRDDAVSVSYWKSAALDNEEKRVLNFTVTLDNPTTSTLEVSPPYFLPKEVKSEHLAAYEGFDLKFDANRRQLYLTRDEKLEPGEKKKFQIGVVDVWSIPQGEIDNLRTRTKSTFSFLEKTIYNDTALFLVKNIKEKLDALEASQAQEKEIREYVGSFSKNSTLYQSARNDVDKLEDLLTALREELERSRLKNVLQKIKQVRSLSDIAEAIFGTKPTPNNAWKIILGVVIFVGLITFVHFIIWGRRSAELKLKTVGEAKTEEKEKQQAKV